MIILRARRKSKTGSYCLRGYTILVSHDEKCLEIDNGELLHNNVIYRVLQQFHGKMELKNKFRGGCLTQQFMTLVRIPAFLIRVHGFNGNPRLSFQLLAPALGQPRSL